MKALSSSASDHATRERWGVRAVQDMARAASAAAEDGRCGVAVERATQMTYWLGKLEAERVGQGLPGELPGARRLVSSTKAKVRRHCAFKRR